MNKLKLIYRAFGLSFDREISQMREAKEQILMQLNNSVLTDEVRELIERVVREEVKRILKRGRLSTIQNHIQQPYKSPYNR